MSKELYKLLDTETIAREDHEGVANMNEMADIYEGRLPKEYDKFFPKGTPRHLVQVIPLAWDDLATQAGRMPDLHGRPRNQTRTELNAVGLQEKIGYSYLRTALPTGKRFMKDLAWWMQVGRAVAIVTPDFEEKLPRMELRDPRTCFPGVKKKVNNTIVELDDLIFKYEMDHMEAHRQGLAPMPDDYSKTKCKVIEYVDRNDWVIVSEYGTSKVGHHGLGIVPGWVFQTFSPNSKSGKSRFKDQVALMVAISRLITAKISYADRLVNPILWTKGHEASLELGPYVINKLGPSGEMGQIAPPTQFQVDRDIETLNQFSRILNRNPEVRQGEIASKGTYTSAKTLEQLSEAIDTVVGSDWDTIGPGLEKLLEICFLMDVALWPDLEKTIEGTLNGRAFFETYIPSVDIAGRTKLRCDYGFGVGGYQGFLMHLQAQEAKTMSRRRVMEAMPGVTDVDDELNLMEIEAMDEAGMAMFLTQAAQGTLDMAIWAVVRKDMAQKGLPLFEAIIKYQDLLAEQAAAAVQQDQSALTVPAAPEEMMMEEPALPGLPPGALV